jgi:hypothetical protein
MLASSRFAPVVVSVAVLAAGGVALAACSGSIQSIDPAATGDAAPGPGSTGDGGATVDGSKVDASGDASAADAAADGSIPEDCKELFAEIEKTRKQATACCPQCAAIQCLHTVADVCCPIAVSNLGFGNELAKLADAYRKKCDAACPAVKCKSPENVCDVSGTCR